MATANPHFFLLYPREIAIFAEMRACGLIFDIINNKYR